MPGPVFYRNCRYLNTTAGSTSHLPLLSDTTFTAGEVIDITCLYGGVNLSWSYTVSAAESGKKIIFAAMSCKAGGRVGDTKGVPYGVSSWSTTPATIVAIEMPVTVTVGGGGGTSDTGYADLYTE
jgi:hypothetical protein